VTILPPPKLAATRFVAFGNSLTEGKLSDGTVDALNAYPARLQGLLLEHYATQQFTVLNRGLGGETTAEGVVRLAGVLARDQAEVLFLDEGVNDLLKNEADASGIVSNLRQMIHQATGRHMTVFVTTLAPAPRLGSAEAVEPTNAQIRVMAPAESAFLVDVYAVLSANVPAFIGNDGLHPTPAGYQRMAETFFDAIREHLEVTATAQERLGLLSRPGRRRQQFR
jgi:lysophospholipase L1-like esterase